MSTGLRIVPAASHTTSLSNLNSSSKSAAHTLSAPSAPGLPDTLRTSLSPPTATTSATSPHSHVSPATSGHPLEARLAAWRATQHNLKMEGLRRQFGIAEPVKRGMELAVVRQGEYRPAILGGSAGVHGDVLEGRDTTIEWEDVYGMGQELAEVPGMHAEMEARLKMDQL